MGPSCWSGVRELEKEPRPAAAARDSRIAAGESPGSPLPEALAGVRGAESWKAAEAVSSGSSGVIDGVGAVDGRKSDGMGGVGSVGLSAGSALLACVAFSIGAALGLEAALWLGEALSAGVTPGLGAVPSVAGRWGDSA